MIILFLVCIVVMGILLIIKFNGFLDGNDFLYMLGVTIEIFSVPFLIISIILILFKPFDYKNFKIKYETLKNINTSSIDIRDTNFTKEIIEINNEIRTHREYMNNKWIGIFYNKNIANFEYLEKEVENNGNSNN